ncbi:hypothetical protein [Streptomyces erythrochromogenes]|uniref:hypothetical protein n=1 Tax=Streptomyces erythrochromogenes TaxID=285574 RepID=UPI0037FDCCA2
MTLRETVPVAVVAAIAMTAFAPQAHADDGQGTSICVINNHASSGTNACGDVVVGTGHMTGTVHAVSSQAQLATQRYESPPLRLLPGAVTSLALPCPVGTALVGGGWRVTPDVDTSAAPVILESGPDDDANWIVTAHNAGTTPFSLQTVNQCTAPPPHNVSH